MGGLGRALDPIVHHACSEPRGTRNTCFSEHKCLLVRHGVTCVRKQAHVNLGAWESGAGGAVRHVWTRRAPTVYTTLTDDRAIRHSIGSWGISFENREVSNVRETQTVFVFFQQCDTESERAAEHAPAGAPHTRHHTVPHAPRPRARAHINH